MPFLATFHLKLQKPPDHVYRPGDLVSGTVWLRSDVDEDVKGISIVLKGCSTVRILDYRGYKHPLKFREDCTLFVAIARDLFEGPQKFKRLETHEWPFGFIFPEVSELHLDGEHLREGAERFESNPHSLPPSMPFDEVCCGGIIYEIEAVLQNSGKKEKIRSQTEDLNFRPYDDRAEVDRVEHREKSFVSRKPPSRSTGQKFRGMFVWDESSRPLTTSFTVHVDVPHHLVLAQLIPVSVRIQHNHDQSTLESPSLSLHTAKIFLVAVTETRLLNLEKFPKGQRFGEAKQSKILDAGVDMRHALTFDTPFDLRRILRTRLEDELLPFTSYSIARSYKLRILLVIKCEGDSTDFTMDFEVPISILPVGCDHRSESRLNDFSIPALDTGLSYQLEPPVTEPSSEALPDYTR